MSDSSKRAEVLSEEGLVGELKKEPSTFKWDAIATYDRPKTNMVLIHEYIDRYSKNFHLEPITDRVEIVAGKHWEYLIDYTLDAPRLSFEDSTILESLANLSMLVIGGTQLSVQQEPPGRKFITKVEWIDPLQTQAVKAVAKLSRSPGTIDEAGQVFLDLSDNLAVKLEFPSTEYAQSRAGLAIQKAFDELPAEKRRYVLNELGAPQDNEFLIPEDFVIRIHRRTVENTPTSVYESEGAVALFVAMQGNAGGTSIPSDDNQMKYLIPAGRSATILLGHRFLVDKIIVSGLRFAANSGSFEYELDNPDDLDAPVGQIKVTSGERSVGQWDITNLERFSSVVVTSPKLLLTDPSNTRHALSMTVANEEFVLRWEGRQDIATTVTPKGGAATTRNVIATWRLEKAFKFEISGGKLVLVGGAAPANLYKISPGTFADVPGIAEYFDDIALALEGKLSELFQGTFADFLKPSEEIDLFRLNGLLFRGSHDEVIQLRSARLPMDLALFGEVAPRLTAFQIDPLETVVSAGGSLQLRVDPPHQNIAWSLEAVPGHEGELGTIGSDGWFSAPPMDLIKGAFTRVRVVAATGEATSSALVKVVARDVTINPVVAATVIGGEPIMLSAAALPGDTVSWALHTGTGATLVCDDEGKYSYVPGDSKISQHAYELDEIVATNATTQKTSVSYMLVKQPISGEVAATVEIDPDVSLPEGQVKLRMILADTLVDSVTWTLRAGSGSIDENGVFQVDPAGQHKFAAIIASGVFQGVLPVHGHIILPIPLVDLDSLNLALS